MVKWRLVAHVVVGVHGKHLAQVSLAEDQHPVGDLVRTVNTKRSAKQFARGHRGGILACGCPKSRVCLPTWRFVAITGTA